MSAPQEAPHTQFKFNGDPVAKTYEQMRTPRQLVALNNFERYQGVDVAAVAMALLGCKVEQLSKKAASALIDYLKSR